MPEQFALSLGHKASLASEDFLITESNQEAVVMLENWENWVNRMLVLFGSEGCGKTHVANMFFEELKRVGLKPVITQALDLTNSFVDDLTTNSDFIIVEEAEKIENEEAFFHLYNSVKEYQRWLLLTSNQAPARWGIKLPDLKSRLSIIPTAEIKEPDDILMAGIIVKMFADRQVIVKQEVVDYLLKNIERSFKYVRHLIEAIDTEAYKQKRPITIPLVKNVMKSLS